MKKLEVGKKETPEDPTKHTTQQLEIQEVSRKEIEDEIVKNLDKNKSIILFHLLNRNVKLSEQELPSLSNSPFYRKHAQYTPINDRHADLLNDQRFLSTDEFTKILSLDQ